MRASQNPPKGSETVHEAVLKIDRIMRMYKIRHKPEPRSMTLESTLSGRVMYTRTSKGHGPKDSD